MRLIFPFVATLLFAAGSAGAVPVRYDLDPNHTRVDFSWTHFGFSHPMGRFDRFDGDFHFDPARITQRASSQCGTPKVCPTSCTTARTTRAAVIRSWGARP